MPLTLEGPRKLLRRLRELMATVGDRQERLDQIVTMIAGSMQAAVCSIYIRRPDDLLELFATEGLNPDSVHKTLLRVGEGLVGDIALHARPLNLDNAPSHPRFAYRPETGEDPFISFVGVPILRSGSVSGVLVVQNATRRNFVDEEVEALQTVAMVLSEMFPSDFLVSDAIEVGDVPRVFNGQGLTEGLALGHVVLHEPRVQVARLIAEDIDDEIRRLDQAVYELRRTIDELLRTEDLSHAGEHLDVLDTYRMFANDRGWLTRITAAIRTGLTAEAAVERVMGDIRARLTGQRDQYLRERLNDFEDLSNRLMRILTGRAVLASEDKLPRDAIVIARTMGPAELLDYDRRKLRGLVLEEAAMGAHVTIVARALNIPMVANVRGLLGNTQEGDEIIVDADQGDVHVNPPGDVVSTYSEQARLRARRLKRYARIRHLPAMTRDGCDVTLNLNAGLMVDVENLQASGALNIGLFRTELQFMVAAKLPRQEQQRGFYRSVLEAAGDRKVVFRTLDIGGDKVLPYMRLSHEDNPAMGWRAIRIALDRPGLLRYQIRALLAAADQRDLHIMFPMVANVAEFRAAKKLVDKESDRARKLGYPRPKNLYVGTMLEVPSLAWELDELLPEVDFLSVGTSDLLQFLFASDRGNPIVGNRYAFLSRPVLRLLSHIRTRASAHNVPVSICGEAAGVPLHALALVALGYTELSIPASAIGPVKRMIRSMNHARSYERMHHLIRDENDDFERSIRQMAEDFGIKL